MDLVIEDDESDPRTIEQLLPQIDKRSDVMLGPYATNLTRVASRIASENGRILWNHGGSGDDIQAAHSGSLVSVLTPTSRYAKPFVKHLSTANAPPPLLVIARGRGAFGRQVAAGASRDVEKVGIHVFELSSEQELPEIEGDWALFSAGTFEDDSANVRRARKMTNRPSVVCSVAAGVREFGDAVADSRETYGIAQWFPGTTTPCPDIGPTERDFLAAYAKTGQPTPDYPAVQAVAAAALATHCVTLAGATTRLALWEAATSLDTTTLFGRFKIDPATGVQVAHETVLLRWTAAGIEPATPANPPT
ncbi:ABC transporter substrate-binding protein [Amycolatopsis sp. NPDC058986]|uniref:ABC transporter substrate-binding protein n=1 Tax=unclassified Amycolatopsis TaxID=2618356 RepID=UPI003671605C